MDSLLGAVSAPIRGYVTGLLQTYLSKYIKDIQLEGLGLLGSDLVLNNLELRLESLQELIPTPLSFEFTRGFVKELRIHIPWTTLLSSSIQVRLDTVECVLTAYTHHHHHHHRHPHDTTDPSSSRNKAPSTKSASSAATGSGNIPTNGFTPVSTTTISSSSSSVSTTSLANQPSGLPDWAQSWLTRIIANISVSINNLVFKYKHEDISLVVGLRSFDLLSADPHSDWSPSFIEPVGIFKHVHKILIIRDFMITIDKESSNNTNNSSTVKYSANSGQGKPPSGPQSTPHRIVANNKPLPSSSSTSPAQPQSLSVIYTEEPVLSKTNIVIRIRVPLDPKGGRTALISKSDENETNDTNESPSASTTPRSRYLEPVGFPGGNDTTVASKLSVTTDETKSLSPLEAVAAAITALPNPSPSVIMDHHNDDATVIHDPFQTVLLSRYSGDLSNLSLPVGLTMNNSLKPKRDIVLPVEDPITLCHLYIDSLDFGVSSRQLHMLQTLLSLRLVHSGGATDARTSHGTNETTTPKDGTVNGASNFTAKVTSAEKMNESDNNDDSSSSDEDEAPTNNGLLGWFWTSMVGTSASKSEEETLPSNSNTTKNVTDILTDNKPLLSLPDNTVSYSLPPTENRVTLINAHIGSVACVFYSHQLKRSKPHYGGTQISSTEGIMRIPKSKSSVPDSKDVPVSLPIEDDRTSQTTDISVSERLSETLPPVSSSSSTTLRVPVANLGFVSITDSLENTENVIVSHDSTDHAVNHSNGSVAIPPSTGKVNVSSSVYNRTVQSYIPVPFLRLSIDPSWFQIRILEEITHKFPSHGTLSSPLTPLSEKISVDIAPVPVREVFTLFDSYIDIGALRLTPWSIAQENALATKLAVTRARRQHVFSLPTTAAYPFPSTSTAAKNAKKSRERSTTNTTTFSSVSSTEEETQSYSSYQYIEDMETGLVLRTESRVTNSTPRKSSDVFSTPQRPHNDRSTPHSSPSVPLTSTPGQTDKLPPIGEENSVSSSVPVSLIMLCGSPGALASMVKQTDFRRHPYFESSLFPDIDADTVAGPENKQNDPTYSLWGAPSSSPVTSAPKVGASGLPLSCRAHIGWLFHKVSQESVNVPNDTVTNTSIFGFTDILVTEIIVRPDVATIRHLSKFAQDVSTDSSVRWSDESKTAPSTPAVPPPLSSSSVSTAHPHHHHHHVHRTMQWMVGSVHFQGCRFILPSLAGTDSTINENNIGNTYGTLLEAAVTNIRCGIHNYPVTSTDIGKVYYKRMDDTFNIVSLTEKAKETLLSLSTHGNDTLKDMYFEKSLPLYARDILRLYGKSTARPFNASQAVTDYESVTLKCESITASELFAMHGIQLNVQVYRNKVDACTLRDASANLVAGTVIIGEKSLGHWLHVLSLLQENGDSVETSYDSSSLSDTHLAVHVGEGCIDITGLSSSALKFRTSLRNLLVTLVNNTEQIVLSTGDSTEGKLYRIDNNTTGNTTNNTVSYVEVECSGLPVSLMLPWCTFDTPEAISKGPYLEIANPSKAHLKLTGSVNAGYLYYPLLSETFEILTSIGKRGQQYLPVPDANLAYPSSNPVREDTSAVTIVNHPTAAQRWMEEVFGAHTDTTEGIEFTSLKVYPWTIYLTSVTSSTDSVAKLSLAFITPSIHLFPIQESTSMKEYYFTPHKWQAQEFLLVLVKGTSDHSTSKIVQEYVHIDIQGTFSIECGGISTDAKRSMSSVMDMHASTVRTMIDIHLLQLLNSIEPFATNAVVNEPTLPSQGQVSASSPTLALPNIVLRMDIPTVTLHIDLHTASTTNYPNDTHEECTLDDHHNNDHAGLPAMDEALHGEMNDFSFEYTLFPCNRAVISIGSVTLDHQYTGEAVTLFQALSYPSALTDPPSNDKDTSWLNITVQEERSDAGYLPSELSHLLSISNHSRPKIQIDCAYTYLTVPVLSLESIYKWTSECAKTIPAKKSTVASNKLSPSALVHQSVRSKLPYLVLHQFFLLRIVTKEISIFLVKEDRFDGEPYVMSSLESFELRIDDANEYETKAHHRRIHLMVHSAKVQVQQESYASMIVKPGTYSVSMESSVGFENDSSHHIVTSLRSTLRLPTELTLPLTRKNVTVLLKVLNSFTALQNLTSVRGDAMVSSSIDGPGSTTVNGLQRSNIPSTNLRCITSFDVVLGPGRISFSASDDGVETIANPLLSLDYIPKDSDTPLLSMSATNCLEIIPCTANGTDALVTVVVRLRQVEQSGKVSFGNVHAQAHMVNEETNAAVTMGLFRFVGPVVSSVTSETVPDPFIVRWNGTYVDTSIDPMIQEVPVVMNDVQITMVSTVLRINDNWLRYAVTQLRNGKELDSSSESSPFSPSIFSFHHLPYRSVVSSVADPTVTKYVLDWSVPVSIYRSKIMIEPFQIHLCALSSDHHGTSACIILQLGRLFCSGGMIVRPGTINRPESMFILEDSTIGNAKVNISNSFIAITTVNESVFHDESNLFGLNILNLFSLDNRGNTFIDHIQGKTIPYLLSPFTLDSQILVRSFPLPSRTSFIVDYPVVTDVHYTSIRTDFGPAFHVNADYTQLRDLVDIVNRFQVPKVSFVQASSPRSLAVFAQQPPLFSSRLSPYGIPSIVDHGLAQLPVIQVSSLVRNPGANILGTTSISTDYLNLAGIDETNLVTTGGTSFSSVLSANSGGGFLCGRIYVSDVVTYVPHYLWDRGDEGSSHSSTFVSSRHVTPAEPFPSHLPYAQYIRMAAAYDRTTYGAGKGAWWGATIWTYALPVSIKDAMVLGPATVAGHTFIRMMKERNNAYGVPVAHPTVPEYLCCVIERFSSTEYAENEQEQRSRRNDSAGTTTDLSVPLAFVNGWVPVVSFQLSVSSSLMPSATNTVTEADPYIQDIVWHGTEALSGQYEDEASAKVQPHRTLQSVSNNASTTWRLRWLEPVLTVSRPDPVAQRMVASVSSTTNTNGASSSTETNNKSYNHDTETIVSNGKELMYRLLHAPYALVCTAIANILRLSVSWMITDPRVPYTGIPTVPRLSFRTNIPTANILCRIPVRDGSITSLPLSRYNDYRYNVSIAVKIDKVSQALTVRDAYHFIPSSSIDSYTTDTSRYLSLPFGPCVSSDVHFTGIGVDLSSLNSSFTTFRLVQVHNVSLHQSYVQRKAGFYNETYWELSKQDQDHILDTAVQGVHINMVPQIGKSLTVVAHYLTNIDNYVNHDLMDERIIIENNTSMHVVLRQTNIPYLRTSVPSGKHKRWFWFAPQHWSAGRNGEENLPTTRNGTVSEAVTDDSKASLYRSIQCFLTDGTEHTVPPKADVWTTSIPIESTSDGVLVSQGIVHTWVPLVSDPFNDNTINHSVPSSLHRFGCVPVYCTVGGPSETAMAKVSLKGFLTIQNALPIKIRFRWSQTVRLTENITVEAEDRMMDTTVPVPDASSIVNDRTRNGGLFSSLSSFLGFGNASVTEPRSPQRPPSNAPVIINTINTVPVESIYRFGGSYVLEPDATIDIPCFPASTTIPLSLTLEEYVSEGSSDDTAAKPFLVLDSDEELNDPTASSFPTITVQNEPILATFLFPSSSHHITLRGYSVPFTSSLDRYHLQFLPSFAIYNHSSLAFTVNCPYTNGTFGCFDIPSVLYDKKGRENSPVQRIIPSNVCTGNISLFVKTSSPSIGFHRSSSSTVISELASPSVAILTTLTTLGNALSEGTLLDGTKKVMDIQSASYISFTARAPSLYPETDASSPSLVSITSDNPSFSLVPILSPNGTDSVMLVNSQPITESIEYPCIHCYAPLAFFNSLDVPLWFVFALAKDGNNGSRTAVLLKPHQRTEILTLPYISADIDGNAVIQGKFITASDKDSENNHFYNNRLWTDDSTTLPIFLPLTSGARLTSDLPAVYYGTFSEQDEPTQQAMEGWRLPIILTTEHGSSFGATEGHAVPNTVPSLTWTIRYRAMVNIQPDIPITWHHALVKKVHGDTNTGSIGDRFQLVKEPSLLPSKDSPAPATIVPGRTVQPLCIRAATLGSMPEPAVAIHLNADLSNPAITVDIGTVLVRLGSVPKYAVPFQSNSSLSLSSYRSRVVSSKDDDYDQESEEVLLPTDISEWKRQLEELSMYLVAPTVPVNHAVRIPILVDRTRVLGVLLLRVLMDADTGTTVIHIGKDPQPPVRLVHLYPFTGNTDSSPFAQMPKTEASTASTTNLSIEVRMKHATALHLEHQSAMQLAYLNPLERFAILTRTITAADVAVSMSTSNDTLYDGTSVTMTAIDTPKSSDKLIKGFCSEEASDIIKEARTLLENEAYKAEEWIKDLSKSTSIERIAGQKDKVAERLETSEPLPIREHPLCCSYYETNPSAFITVDTGTVVDFDWNFLTDFGLSFDNVDGLARWTPAYPLSWTLASVSRDHPSTKSKSTTLLPVPKGTYNGGKSKHTSSPTSSQGSRRRTPSLPLTFTVFDIDTTPNACTHLFDIARSWRAVAATAHVQNSRVFDTDAPILHQFPALEYRRIGEPDFYPAVIVPSHSSSKTTDSPVTRFYADLRNGSLCVQLYAPGMDLRPEDNYPKNSNVVLENYCNFTSFNIREISLSLLHPLPILTPRAAIQPYINGNESDNQEHLTRIVPVNIWWNTWDILHDVSTVTNVDGTNEDTTAIMVDTWNSPASSTDPSDTCTPFVSVPLGDSYLLHRPLLSFHISRTSIDITDAYTSVSFLQSFRFIQLAIDNIQIDDYQQEARFPVVLAIESIVDEDKLRLQQHTPAIECSLRLDLVPGHRSIPSSVVPKLYSLSTIDIGIGAVRVQLSDTTVDGLTKAYGPWLPVLVRTVQSLPHPNATIGESDTVTTTSSSSFPHSETVPSVSVNRIGIGAIQAELTICTEKENSPFFFAADRMPVHIAAVTLSQVVSNPAIMGQEILASYIADMILRSPALIGSLDLLGNPTGLARSLSTGLHDIFAQPLHAWKRTNGNVWATLQGFGRGWLLFAGHTTEGALSSVAGFTMSLAKNLDRISQQHTSIGKPSMTSTASTSVSQSGLSSINGTESFFSGNRNVLSMYASNVLPWYTLPSTVHYTNASPAATKDVVAETENLFTVYFSPESTSLMLVTDNLDALQPSNSTNASSSGSSAGVANPSLLSGVTGLGRGLFGAVSNLASASIHILAEPGKESLINVGKGLAGAVVRPVAGALEFVAHAASSAMQTLRMSQPLVQKHLPMYTVSGSNNLSCILANLQHYGSGDTRIASSVKLAIISPVSIIVNDNSTGSYPANLSDKPDAVVFAWFLLYKDGSLMIVPYNGTSDPHRIGPLPWYEIIPRAKVQHIGEIRKPSSSVPSSLLARSIGTKGKMNLEEKYMFTLLFRLQVDDKFPTPSSSTVSSPVRSSQFTMGSPVRNQPAPPKYSALSSTMNERTGFSAALATPHSFVTPTKSRTMDENTSATVPNSFNPFLRTPTFTNTPLNNNYLLGSRIEITDITSSSSSNSTLTTAVGNEDKSTKDFDVNASTTDPSVSSFVTTVEIHFPLSLRRNILSIFRSNPT